MSINYRKQLMHWKKSLKPDLLHLESDSFIGEVISLLPEIFTSDRVFLESAVHFHLMEQNLINMSGFLVHVRVQPSIAESFLMK